MQPMPGSPGHTIVSGSIAGRWNNALQDVLADMNEVTVVRRRRSWEWQLRDRSGSLIVGGRERSRPAARYQGYRALFMLLAASWRLSDLHAPQRLTGGEKFRHT